MSEAISKQSVKEELNALIEVDFDAIAAYQAAIERLDSDALKSKFREFLRDHERHVSQLSSAVIALGDEPATKGDLKRFLTKGKVVIADFLGDKAIMMAMKTNEDQTNKAYKKALEGHYPQDVRDIMLNGLSDEQSHRDWIMAKLKAME